jgi:hypothetical protein
MELVTLSDVVLPPREPHRASLDSCVSNPEDINLLKRFREDCKRNQLAHLKAHRTYKLCHHLCPTVSLGVSACSGVITIVLSSTLTASPLAIVSGITSIAVGSLLAIGKACSFEGNMIMHEQHVGLFGEMVRDIHVEHSLHLIGKS